MCLMATNRTVQMHISIIVESSSAQCYLHKHCYSSKRHRPASLNIGQTSLLLSLSMHLAPPLSVCPLQSSVSVHTVL